MPRALSMSLHSRPMPGPHVQLKNKRFTRHAISASSLLAITIVEIHGVAAPCQDSASSVGGAQHVVKQRCFAARRLSLARLAAPANTKRMRIQEFKDECLSRAEHSRLQAALIDYAAQDQDAWQLTALIRSNRTRRVADAWLRHFRIWSKFCLPHLKQAAVHHDDSACRVRCPSHALSADEQHHLADRYRRVRAAPQQIPSCLEDSRSLRMWAHQALRRDPLPAQSIATASSLQQPSPPPPGSSGVVLWWRRHGLVQCTEGCAEVLKRQNLPELGAAVH
mmetsp:Transcript_134209/g.244823  ORF Transcript_134209/g.244823 Transcript_134209/m.244823 type:complete len:279 (+) Transcript_134209:553-1389(+)